MANERVVVDLLANDRASAGFAAMGRSAQAASEDLDKLAKRLGAINDMSAKARVGLEGDKESLAQLDRLDLKMGLLARRVAKPEVTLVGAAKMAAEISALDAAMDRLNKKNAGPGLNTWGGLLSRIVPGMLGGGPGGALAGIGGTGQGATGIGAAFATPGAAGASIAAALAALPFLAQAAASAITFTLGGALAGVGVYAEKGVRSVGYQFSQLWSGQNGIQKTFANISPAFGQAITTILSAARTFVPQFIRDFGPALNAIAGPFKAFGVELAGSLANPAIAASLKALGEAFGGILKALTPAIPGIVTAIADGFTNLFRAVGRNPKAIADVAIALGHLIGILLDTIAWLTNVAAYIEQHAIPAWHDLQKDILNWEMNASAAVQRFWHDTVRFLDTWRHDIAAQFSGFYHDTLAIFNRVKTDVANIWSSIWNNTVDRVKHGVNDVITWMTALKLRTLQALGGWGNDLNRFARQALNLLWEGAKAGAQPIVGWFTGFAKGIVGVFKKIWGWFSPSSVMYEGGKSLMQGLANGIRDHAHLAQAQASKAGKGVSTPYGGGYGVGVAQWVPDILRVLAMEGLPPSLAFKVGYQMQTESGGNPNAINLWDINAQHGDPSRGLMQVIMSTFQSYHWPGTSWDIYDPIANIAAAVNYARHVYGPTLQNSSGMGIGSGHGYDQGGWLMPGVTMAVNTSGRPERVTSGPAEDALLAELAAVVDRLDTLIGVTAGVGSDVASGLNGAARAAGYSAMYGTRP